MTGGGEEGASEPPPGPSKRARVDDDATPFYYMLESHRDDGKQTVLWNVEADRAMTLAEGIAWIQNNRPNKRQRRR